MSPSNHLKTGPARLNFLYTNIGRGHPFYLDGVIEALIRTRQIGLVRNETDVFQVSHGRSALAWKMARWMYKHGSSRGLVGWLYDHLRSERDYNKPDMMMSIMGRDIRNEFYDDDDPLIVAHPSLVGILAGKPDLLYQHGEVVAPRESLVKGATIVFVPTEETAQSFIDGGYNHSNIFITGLCIEPGLTKQAADAYDMRIERLTSGESLTGIFCSSGAEPRQHVNKLVAAAISAALNNNRVFVFAKKSGVVAARIVKAMMKVGLEYSIVESTDYLPADLPPVMIVRYSSRREENRFMAHLFPLFDYLVAPSHERTNWALGLGLPLFILGPAVGPFAPLNRDLLLNAGVAECLDAHVDAHLFGTHVVRLQKSGKLAEMAQSGWGKNGINGFEKIAEFLVNKYTYK